MEESSANANSSDIHPQPRLQDHQPSLSHGGQVTYRVVQVAQDGTEGAQVVTTNAFPVGTQLAQAVVSPFSNGGSPTPDQTETRFTYFPATATPEAAAVTSQQPEVTTASAIGSITTGQFYVMMSPQDVLQGQRNIAPRTGFTPKIEGGRSSRDDRRRATHNEVERRRRDKINTWIVQLSKIVPECAQEQSKSKGGILSKACDYINELKTANTRMAESLKETERLTVDAELLRQQCEELKNENAILRAQLQQHGIIPDLSGDSFHCFSCSVLKIPSNQGQKEHIKTNYKLH
ncbi:hypothetical protein KUTeg_006188, partial [Tegillarca granosa]